MPVTFDTSHKSDSPKSSEIPAGPALIIRWEDLRKQQSPELLGQMLKDKITPIPIKLDPSLAEIEACLVSWVNDGFPRESREIARVRILEILNTENTTPGGIFGKMSNTLFSCVLDLSGLNLTSLPGIFHAPALSSRINVLKLSNNQLSSFPETIFGMQALKVLLLDHNPIWGIPNEIEGLKSLENLNISHTRLIEKLPLSLLKLSKTCTVYLTGCPFDSIRRLLALEGIILETPNSRQIPKLVYVSTVN